MKQYPSIDHDLIHGKPYYFFDKLDGSNVRAEWTPKKGFNKFGSRTQLIDEKTSPMGRLAIPLIKAQEDAIAAVLRDMRVEEATCFFEFFGPSSFAGVHVWNDEFQVALLDVSLYKQGMMKPRDFIRAFYEENISVPTLLHHGNITEEIIDLVKTGTMPGMTFEGIVGKGDPLKKGYPPHMMKLKSEAWINKVKSIYKDAKMLKELL